MTRQGLRLVFIGPPGVGKGTQAQGVAERHGIPRISTGDLLRSSIQRGTPLGRQAKAFVDSGGLVPDELVVGMVRERVQAEDCRNGYILDGFPRTTGQAEALDTLLRELQQHLDLVVSFQVAEPALIARLTGRRSCPACQAVYHVEFNPPRGRDICDLCGGMLVQRSDDQETTIRKRLEVYRTQTEPLLEYYRARHLLASLGGDGPVQEVSARLEEMVQRPGSIRKHSA